MWGMCTNLTASKILVPLRDGPGNGQRSYFSTLWITPFSQRVSLFPPFVVQSFHINYSYLHWLGTYEVRLESEDTKILNMYNIFNLQK